MDGTIVFETKLNNSELKKQLQTLKDEIKEYDKQLSNYEKQKTTKQKYVIDNSDRYESEKAIYGSKGSAFINSYEEVLRQIESIELAEQNVSVARDMNISKIEETQKVIEEASKKEEELKLRAEETQKATKGLVKQFTSLGTLIKSRLKRQLISGIMNSISTGFNMLMKYSPELKASFNSLKNSMAQLGGSIVSAFAPLLESLIPIFTKIIDFANRVAVAISKMIAVITGKNKISKAIKAQKDYTNAVNGSSKALASFDEINQLNNKDQDSLSFEEEEMDTSEVEKFKAILETILPLVTGIGSALLLWKFKDLFGLGTQDIIGISLIIAGITEAVIGLWDALNNGLDEDNLVQIILGFTLIAGGLLLVLGPTAMAIGLLVAGLTLLVLGIKDAIETGEITKESLIAIEVGLLAIGVAIALLTGSWIPLAIAGILMVVALIVAKWDLIKEKTSELWENIKLGFKDGINAMIGYVESFVNFFIDARNKIADALNSIQIDVPWWVPGIGGQTIGFNIPRKDHISIPRLATGTVVPPNAGEFLAMLGDNKTDTEIVSPLETMKQAMIEALQSQGNNVTIKFDGNLSQLARYLKPAIDKENSRVGTSLVVGG